MLGTFNFRCRNGHEFEALVYKDERNIPCPKCDWPGIRIFTVCQNTLVPDHMKAPGSSRSTSELIEKDRAIRNGPRGKALREQNERINRRAEAVENAKDKHFSEAANSTKMQNAYRDMMHEQATAKPKRKR